jgi:hypothetical protein
MEPASQFAIVLTTRKLRLRRFLLTPAKISLDEGVPFLYSVFIESRDSGDGSRVLFFGRPPIRRNPLRRREFSVSPERARLAIRSDGHRRRRANGRFSRDPARSEAAP